MTATPTHIAVWCIAAAVTAGVLVRPFDWPEAVWAVAGSLALVAFGLLPTGDAVEAVGKGADVYLFLVGMMLLSEVARREGVFEWVAGHAVKAADGSSQRLFLLVYAVGTVVTTFLSNDAAAVVLTPAVFAAAKQAKAEALPYLFICAFIANAASFVLPISNPANLVLYGDHVPPLGHWLRSFALPSVMAIAATYGMLWWVQGRRLDAHCGRAADVPALPNGGRTALAGIGVTAVTLTTVSAMDQQLGLPTCLLGLATTGAVLAIRKASPLTIVRGVSWAVLPLVAGLFVLVEALNRTGVSTALAGAMKAAVGASASAAAAGCGALLAVVANVVNNLPAGLVASTTLQQARPPQPVVDALLIGVDLGPNLSITGSLATILWLTAIRREGQDVGFWQFLKTGAVVMPPALLLALGARLVVG